MRQRFLACLLCLASCLPAAAQTTTEFKGHTGLVFDVAVSPDGSTLATASFDNTIKLWDIKTAKEKTTLKGHTAPVYSVAFSPDGSLIASSGADNTIRVWDKEGKFLREMKGHSDLVQAVAFAPDNSTLASAGGTKDKSVRLWNAKEGKEIKTLGTQKEAVYTVAFSPDGNFLASGGNDTTIRIFDIKAGKEIKMLGELPKEPVKIDPKKKDKKDDKKDEKKDKDKKEEKKIDEKKVLDLPEIREAVTHVLFAPDNKTVLSVGYDKMLRFWNAAEGKETKKAIGPTKDYLHGLALSKDGKKIATAGYGGSIRIYELDSDKVIFQADLKKTVTYTVAFTPDGNSVIIGGEKNNAAFEVPLKAAK